MGGFFGVTSKNDCVLDIFFGVDYHSHLGTKKGGMALHSKEKASSAKSITSKTHLSVQNSKVTCTNLKAAFPVSAVFPTTTLSLCWFAPIWAHMPSQPSVPSTTQKNCCRQNLTKVISS